MFERYTENARRVIFFARYEASQLGSSEIDTEHLLLGLLRETKALLSKLEAHGSSADGIRKKIESRVTWGKKFPTSVDLPLSNGSKRVLAYAAEEAERLSHRHIGSEHLVLGLLREKKGLAAHLLEEAGLSLQSLREEIHLMVSVGGVTSTTTLGNLSTLEVHGRHLAVAYVTKSAEKLKQFAWVRRDWKPVDVLVDNQDGGICFDLSLQGDPRFKLVAGGWTKEPCALCGWELNADGAPEHREAFTNGRRWLCTECYSIFVAKNDTRGAA